MNSTEKVVEHPSRAGTQRASRRRPLALDVPGGGVAVVFRYGAAVLFGAATPAMDNFIASSVPLVTGALSAPERDDVRLLVRPDADQRVDLAGNIMLREKTTERLQLVADIPLRIVVPVDGSAPANRAVGYALST